MLAERLHARSVPVLVVYHRLFATPSFAPPYVRRPCRTWRMKRDVSPGRAMGSLTTHSSTHSLSMPDTDVLTRSFAGEGGNEGRATLTRVAPPLASACRVDAGGWHRAEPHALSGRGRGHRRSAASSGTDNQAARAEAMREGMSALDRLNPSGAPARANQHRVSGGRPGRTLLPALARGVRALPPAIPGPEVALPPRTAGHRWRRWRRRGRRPSRSRSRGCRQS
jgi:hypothetical protein